MVNTTMTKLDQKLISEAYVTEIFGMGEQSNLIELKDELDPDSFHNVVSVFTSLGALRKPNPFVKRCSEDSCLINPNYIEKTCGMLKRIYDERSADGGDDSTDSIIDAHDALMQLKSGGHDSGHSTPPSTLLYR